MSSITDLITRNYTNFRGVDFSFNDVILSRSPDTLNMWKNYKEGNFIQTRPGLKEIGDFGNQIYGLFFYQVNNVVQVLVHSGTKMYKWNNYPNSPVNKTELYTGLNPKASNSFVFNNIFFFKDGINYLEYDGETMKEVVGTVPVTSYWKNPAGDTPIDSDTDSDLVYQPINCLTSWRRNYFIADGKSKEYKLDTIDLDPLSMSNLVTATINGSSKTENIDFTVDRKNGTITFNDIPSIDSEVMITFSKTIANHKDRINKCNLLCEFDNRIFFSGNVDYPNSVFHCMLNDPRYVSDMSYYECGLDLAPVRALIPGNGVLWVIKEINQNSSSVYYLTPTLDNTLSKIYPSVNGSIALGCVSKGINFNDDVVFFSKQGLESVSSSALYSEQVLEHRSSLVDRKMLSENDYENVQLAEFNGYLLCLMGSHVYLANSNELYQDSTGTKQYEWYYWELANNINFIKEYRQKLFFGNAVGKIYQLDVEGEESVESYWTTPKDDFGYPAYTKTTNKRGNVADLKVMNNDSIKVSTIVDGVLKEKTILSDATGHITYRIKDKKFKDIQLKFSSNKPFGLFSCTLQGFVAGYLKK